MKQILILLLLFSCNDLFSQEKPIKWGKISQAELDLQVVDYDSSANAVILCDYQKITASRNDGVLVNRHVRIKILNESAKDQADIRIRFYHKEGTERITSRNALTMNMVDGKLIKKQVSKKEFFKTQLNDKWSEIRFSFPDVKAGSILEYSYTKEANSYGIDSWVFPNHVPTLKSFCHLVISSGLDYNVLFQGHRIVQKYQNKTSNHWVLENLPAIKDEPFCPNPFDFTDKVKFQLAGYLTGSGSYHKVMGTWKSVAKDFYDEGGIRYYLNKNKDADQIIDQIISPEDTPEDKVKKIYDYVTSNFIWNRNYRLLPSNAYKEFKSSKKGNSAEINLYFINLLQSAGLSTYPALVSTKQHGYVSKSFVFYSQFNNLIACAKVGDQELLIDATNPFRPYNLLDDEDLNKVALVLNKKEPYWLDIIPYKKSKNVKLVTMEMLAPDLIKYKIEINAKGYDALEMREELAEEEGDLKNYFNKRLVKENAEYRISQIEVTNKKEKDKSLRFMTSVEQTNLSTESGDFVYISPFVDRFYDANPFNDKDRYLPIDFYHPFEEAYILNFEVPEGYEMVEYPEALNIATEGKKGILKFSSSLNGNKFQMRISFAIKEPFFTAFEYPVLREIYDRYIEKREEQIVLKKL